MQDEPEAWPTAYKLKRNTTYLDPGNPFLEESSKVSDTVAGPVHERDASSRRHFVDFFHSAGSTSLFGDDDLYVPSRDEEDGRKTQQPMTALVKSSRPIRAPAATPPAKVAAQTRQAPKIGSEQAHVAKASKSLFGDDELYVAPLKPRRRGKGEKDEVLSPGIRRSSFYSFYDELLQGGRRRNTDLRSIDEA